MPRTRHIYIYMTLLMIDMDFLYQFNLWFIAPLFTVSFHEKFEKIMFFKIFKSWQVCDWLAKWIIMLPFMDLRWPRVFRRSNVGLVYCFSFVQWILLKLCIEHGSAKFSSKFQKGVLTQKMLLNSKVEASKWNYDQNQSYHLSGHSAGIRF